MITHAGEVRSVAEGRALIAVATSGCSSCGHLGGCGIGKLAGNRRETLIALPSLPGLAAGDAVNLELDEAQVTRAALRGYLLPALLMVIGAILGQIVGEKVGVTVGNPLFGTGGTALGVDVTAALGAVCGMASGLLLARYGRPLTPRMSRQFIL
jgi:sigma-E factor negative regulatory protein RseC